LLTPQQARAPVAASMSGSGRAWQACRRASAQTGSTRQWFTPVFRRTCSDTADRVAVHMHELLRDTKPRARTANPVRTLPAQVEYAEEAGALYVFRYPVAGGAGEALPVATTRPETILGDTAVAVHPQDARYAALVGRECEVPLSGGRCAPDPGADTHACSHGPGSRCVLRAGPRCTR